jgi:hypothetical protein
MFGPEYEFRLGWADFPPLPEDATDSDFESYLAQCSFDTAVVDTANQLTVTILDPDR